jgi:hypothetical protein
VIDSVEAENEVDPEETDTSEPIPEPQPEPETLPETESETETEPQPEPEPEPLEEPYVPEISYFFDMHEHGKVRDFSIQCTNFTLDYLNGELLTQVTVWYDD